jgi:hypothetical protein
MMTAYVLVQTDGVRSKRRWKRLSRTREWSGRIRSGPTTCAYACPPRAQRSGT